MKVAVLVLALVALSSSSPQPRKVFHEHFDDFVNLIAEEVGNDLGDLLLQYMEFEEFQTSLAYFQTNSFRDLAYEMESLPEFQALIEFLEKDNIDIMYFLDLFNELLDQSTNKKRVTASGKNLSSYIDDSIALFPKDKLQALFEQKKAEDEAFKVAVENLLSDEWHQVLTALLENETFQQETQVLSDHGIDIFLLLDEIKAIFGQ